MAVTVHLPKVGMTMEEGTLVRWIVPDGGHVKHGEPIFEMETEKVEMEVEADGEGVLKHLVSEGTTLKPGAIVAALLAEGETEVPRAILDQLAAEQAGGAPQAVPATASTGTQPMEAQATTDQRPGARGGRIVATPLARRIAAEHSIDLAAITGTGPNGRIVEADVRAYVNGSAVSDGSTEAGAEALARTIEPHQPRKVASYSGRRRTIGERMHQSLQSMAQLTLISEVRVDDTMRMLHGLNREWRSERIVITLTAVVVRACALALREHPRLNSRLAGDSIVLEPAVHVGFALNLEEGLIVPVVRDADTRSLKEVAQAIAATGDRARDGHLSVGDVTGGTFTVTSLEALNVDAFTPIINPPQAAILGVGRVKQVAVVEGGRVEVGQATTLSLTFDHRLIDGDPAARFLARVGEFLGRPYLLM